MHKIKIKDEKSEREKKAILLSKASYSSKPRGTNSSVSKFNKDLNQDLQVAYQAQ